MKKAVRICLIEDDEIMGESLAERFRIEGFSCTWARDGTQAMQALREKSFDLVVSDLRLGDMGGDDVFAWAQTTLERVPPYVFITGYGAVDQAVSLIKLGARDYVTKPFDLDTFICKIGQWVPPAPGDGGCPCPLGVSPPMQAIAASLPRIAQAATTVLVVGESGVGKERVAQALHAARSDAARRPFVAVNCGGLSESLLEAELFGYEKGAFTGASRTKPGVFEQAHRGTLFLDEIGEMPPSMQVKLLRVLQERQVVRVGGETALPIDILLICATHRDLRKMVAAGGFREDLYYRINVLQIKVPPLRDRPEDVLLLAERFLAEIAERGGEPVKRIHPSAEPVLLDYPWPGNVRELHHAIERAAILCNGSMITAATLFPDESRPPPLPRVDPGRDEEERAASLGEHLRQCERRYIVSALREQQWQIAHTAERLGISRKNLWEKMRKLDIEAPNGASG